MASSVVDYDMEIPEETRRFTWRVANFKAIQDSDELLQAFKIELEIGSEIGFPCKFEAHLSAELVSGGKCWLVIRTELVQSPERSTAVVMKWTELRAGNTSAHNISNEIPHDYKKYGRGIQAFVIGTRRGNRICYDPKLELEEDGSLILHLELTLFSADGVRSLISSGMDKFQDKFSNNLSQAMNALQKEPCVSAGAPDMVKLISKEGKEFPVNWLILAARSPVFKTMFQTPMSETKDGIVKLDDIGGDALGVFLHFLHTATLMDNWEEDGILEELAYAAHKYGILDLLEFLDETLGSLGTPENFGKLLRLTENLELKKAKKEVMKKIVEKMKQAKGSAEMIELCENVAFDQHEDMIYV